MRAMKVASENGSTPRAVEPCQSASETRGSWKPNLAIALTPPICWPNVISGNPGPFRIGLFLPTMTTANKCAISSCEQTPAATLDSQPLCREHFILVSYKRLDQYEEIRKGPGLAATDTESVRRFVHEAARAADAIEHTAQDLDNLERAKLLHIILSASELGRHLRCSPRKVATIPVRLCSE